MKVSAKALFQGLTGRTLVLVMGSILTFMAVLSLLFFLGTGRILSSWHENETAALNSFIEGRLAPVALDAQKTGSPITAAATASALEGLPYSPSWLVVTAADGRFLYLWREAGRNAPMRMQGMPNMRNAQNMPDVRNWNEIRRADGELAFRYSARIPAFNEKESNKVLLGAARFVLVWGLAIASIVAFTFALIFARPLKKQSSTLVSSLDRMAAGERNIPFPGCPVTEFDRISRAASILQKNLVREEGLRRQWAADVAHDLRTPLTVLRGQLEGMIDGVFKPDVARLSRLETETARLEALINSLALLTRIETPGFTPARKRIEVGAFLAEIAERFKEEASASGSPILVDSPGIAIFADPVLLGRAVDNLVSNALHYGMPGGAIRLLGVAEAGSDKASIIVENDGVIDPEIQSRLFDRLFRADSSRNAEGAGLGLSIAKAIIEAHHGTIGSESNPELKRTRFIITFT